MLFSSSTTCIKKGESNNHMKNRDRLDIISLFLEAAKLEKNSSRRCGDGSGRGAKPTRIMYNAFLSRTQLKLYLTYLVDNGLLQYDSVSQTFQTTEKGLVFLRTCGKMDEMIKIPPETRTTRLTTKKGIYLFDGGLVGYYYYYYFIPLAPFSLL
jgi:predicted transcriptional regulator